MWTTLWLVARALRQCDCCAIFLECTGPFSMVLWAGSGCPVHVSVNFRDSTWCDTSFSFGRLWTRAEPPKGELGFWNLFVACIWENLHIWIISSKLVCVRRHVFTAAFGLFLRAFFYHSSSLRTLFICGVNGMRAVLQQCNASGLPCVKGPEAGDVSVAVFYHAEANSCALTFASVRATWSVPTLCMHSFSFWNCSAQSAFFEWKP